MARPTHTDLMAMYGGNLDEVYNCLLRDQEGSVTVKGIWFGVLTAAACLVAWKPEWRWGALAVAMIALERSVWHSVEASNRNQLMHQVSMARWLKVELRAD